MDVQPTNLQQLHYAIVSIWTKISEECFQHLVESMPRRIKAVLKAKLGPSRYWQGVPNKAASEHKSSICPSMDLKILIQGEHVLLSVFNP